MNIVDAVKEFFAPAFNKPPAPEKPIEPITKEDYLAAREAWKQNYAALTEEIRALRKKMRQPGGDSYAQSARAYARARAWSEMDKLDVLKDRARKSWEATMAAAA